VLEWDVSELSRMSRESESGLISSHSPSRVEGVEAQSAVDRSGF
jgi:hypothetical protein